MWPVQQMPAGYVHTGYNHGYFHHQPLPILENSERRKEKSRDAARCRRSRETEIFTDLANALPLSAATVNSLDKASIMRLAISYLRMHSILDAMPEEVGKRDTESQQVVPANQSSDLYDTLYLKAIEGFLLIISADGDLVFLSENVSEYLGLSQIDLMGQSVYEVSHPCDHSELKEILTGKEGEGESPKQTFFLRMKCTLTSKGRNVNLKSATYKVIQCTGHMVSCFRSAALADKDGSEDEGVDAEGPAEPQMCLVAVGEPIPHPADIQKPLGHYTFLSKHSLDMKFTYADDKMQEFLGYDPDSLIGKSIYEFYHAQDTQSVGKSFKGLMSKGQTQTGSHRFLARGGGYVWVLTQATLIYNNKGHKPQSIVCVHFVTSGLEHKDEIYSSSQLVESSVAVKREVHHVEVKREAQQTGEQVARKLFPQPQPRLQPQPVTAKVFVRPAVVTSKLLSAPEARPAPTSVTAKLFKPLSELPQQAPTTATSKLLAPRTEDMNKGFLSYSDDENTLTIMKDEPEDLTHLAPTAGDTCVPLVPFNEVLMDHFMLSENYGPLLSDAKEASPASSPYLSYRDEGSLSPGLTHSPSSLPSLLGEESPPLEGTSMSSLLGLDMDSLDSDDLSVKAPYISMSEGDDFPLLMSGDLMWGASLPSPSHNTAGWSSPPPLVDKPVPADMDSSLAKLLRTDSPSSARIFSQHSTVNNSHSTFSIPKKGEIDRRKRPVSELSGSARTNCKRSKQSPSTNTIPRPGVLDGGGNSGGGSSGGGTRQSNSVLMNLLVSGCDVSAGYICLNARKPYAHSYTPWS